MSQSTLGFLVASIFVQLISSASAEQSVDFARQIRPILSDKCFFCHGPDEGHRKADLRLDEEESAKDSVIVEGDVRASELMARILSDDEDTQMPPPEIGKSLSNDEIVLIKKWIEQGAKWSGHWSFDPPIRPSIPDVAKNAPENWKQPIDRFVSHMLADREMTPNQVADRNTLIRRVTLDLTGLPPTPAEVDAFLADDKPGAYDRLVDRLLETDAYAERMALAWMGAARYGDTSVMHADGPRYMWPWRDLSLIHI